MKYCYTSLDYDNLNSHQIVCYPDHPAKRTKIVNYSDPHSYNGRFKNQTTLNYSNNELVCFSDPTVHDLKTAPNKKLLVGKFTTFVKT